MPEREEVVESYKLGALSPFVFNFPRYPGETGLYWMDAMKRLECNARMLALGRTDQRGGQSWQYPGRPDAHVIGILHLFEASISGSI